MKITPNDFKHVKINLFSKIREISDGNILPPTKEEFFAVWNKYHGHFDPAYGVNTKRLAFIIGGTIPNIDDISNEFKTEERARTVLAWTRMILLFGLNYEIKRKFDISPNERIDFIGSTKHERKYKKDFYNCNVLLLENDKLEEMLNMFETVCIYQYEDHEEAIEAYEEALDYFEKYIHDIHETIGK